MKAKKKSAQVDEVARCSECREAVPSKDNLSDCFECAKVVDACESCIQDHTAEEHPDDIDEEEDDY